MMGDGYTDALVLEATGTWWWPSLGELSLYPHGSACPPLPPWPHTPHPCSSSSSFLEVSKAETSDEAATVAPSSNTTRSMTHPLPALSPPRISTATAWTEGCMAQLFRNAMREDPLVAASKWRPFFSAVTDAAMPMEVLLSSMPSHPPPRSPPPPPTKAEGNDNATENVSRASSPDASPSSLPPLSDGEGACLPGSGRQQLAEEKRAPMAVDHEHTQRARLFASPEASRRTVGLSRLGRSTFQLEAYWYTPLSPSSSSPSFLRAAMVSDSLYVRVKNPLDDEILFLKVLELPSSLPSPSAVHTDASASSSFPFLSETSLSAWASSGQIRITPASLPPHTRVVHSCTSADPSRMLGKDLTSTPPPLLFSSSCFPSSGVAKNKKDRCAPAKEKDDAEDGRPLPEGEPSSACSCFLPSSSFFCSSSSSAVVRPWRCHLDSLRVLQPEALHRAEHTLFSWLDDYTHCIQRVVKAERQRPRRAPSWTAENDRMASAWTAEASGSSWSVLTMLLAAPCGVGKDMCMSYLYHHLTPSLLGASWEEIPTMPRGVSEEGPLPFPPHPLSITHPTAKTKEKEEEEDEEEIRCTYVVAEYRSVHFGSLLAMEAEEVLHAIAQVCRPPPVLPVEWEEVEDDDDDEEIQNVPHGPPKKRRSRKILRIPLLWITWYDVDLLLPSTTSGGGSGAPSSSTTASSSSSSSAASGFHSAVAWEVLHQLDALSHRMISVTMSRGGCLGGNATAEKGDDHSSRSTTSFSIQIPLPVVLWSVSTQHAPSSSSRESGEEGVGEGVSSLHASASIALLSRLANRGASSSIFLTLPPLSARLHYLHLLSHHLQRYGETQASVSCPLRRRQTPLAGMPVASPHGEKDDDEKKNNNNNKKKIEPAEVRKASSRHSRASRRGRNHHSLDSTSRDGVGTRTVPLANPPTPPPPHDTPVIPSSFVSREGEASSRRAAHRLSLAHRPPPPPLPPLSIPPLETMSVEVFCAVLQQWGTSYLSSLPMLVMRHDEDDDKNTTSHVHPMDRPTAQEATHHDTTPTACSPVRETAVVPTPIEEEKESETICPAPFASFFGLEEVLQALHTRLLWPLTHLSLLRQFSIPCVKGAVLCGPSGSGKTALLAALAQYLTSLSAAKKEGEAADDLWKRRGRDATSSPPSALHVMVRDALTLVEKEVGKSEQNIAALFQEARALAPTVLFLDNLEAIAAPRGGVIASPSSSSSSNGGGREHRGPSDSSHTATDRMLSTLLVEMDGLHAHTTHTRLDRQDAADASSSASLPPLVVLISSASSLHHLDPAVYRPGRLDVHLWLTLPSKEVCAEVVQERLLPVVFQDPHSPVQRYWTLQHQRRAPFLQDASPSSLSLHNPPHALDEKPWIAERRRTAWERTLQQHMQTLIHARYGLGASFPWAMASRRSQTTDTRRSTAEDAAPPSPFCFASATMPSSREASPASFCFSAPPSSSSPLHADGETKWTRRHVVAWRSPSAPDVLADVREITLALLGAWDQCASHLPFLSMRPGDTVEGVRRNTKPNDDGGNHRESPAEDGGDGAAWQYPAEDTIGRRSPRDGSAPSTERTREPPFHNEVIQEKGKEIPADAREDDEANEEEKAIQAYCMDALENAFFALE